ncbi:Protein of unknown function, partial [Gryllus bimaculatus]
ACAELELIRVVITKIRRTVGRRQLVQDSPTRQYLITSQLLFYKSRFRRYYQETSNISIGSAVMAVLESTIGRLLILTFLIPHFIISWCMFANQTKQPVLWGIVIAVLESILTHRIRTHVLLYFLGMHGVVSWTEIITNNVYARSPLNGKCMAISFPELVVLAACLALSTVLCRRACDAKRRLILMSGIIGTVICEIILLIFHFLYIQEKNLNQFFGIPFYCYLVMVMFYGCAVSAL